MKMKKFNNGKSKNRLKKNRQSNKLFEKKMRILLDDYFRALFCSEEQREKDLAKLKQKWNKENSENNI